MSPSSHVFQPLGAPLTIHSRCTDLLITSDTSQYKTGSNLRLDFTKKKLLLKAFNLAWWRQIVKDTLSNSKHFARHRSLDD
jgi:hypothetical protein